VSPGTNRIDLGRVDGCVNYFPILGKLFPTGEADEAAESLWDSTGIAQTVPRFINGDLIGELKKTETQSVFQTFHPFISEAIDD
jgi:hypothetical protein